MVDRFERFSYAVFEISRCWHKLAAEEMAKYDLKGPHAIYLITMRRYPEGITAAGLGEVCAKDKADVSRAMAMLEKKGLIKKEEVNNNLYRARLKLTDEGERAMEALSKRAEVAVGLAGKGMSDEEREIFYKSFELIASNLKTLSKEGLPQNE